MAWKVWAWPGGVAAGRRGLGVALTWRRGLGVAQRRDRGGVTMAERRGLSMAWAWLERGLGAARKLWGLCSWRKTSSGLILLRGEQEADMH